MATALLTAKGRDTVTASVNQSTPAQPKFIGWGENLNTLAVVLASDVGLYNESPTETRATGSPSVTTTTTTDDTYTVTGTITCSGSGKTISEVAITDSATKPFTTTWNSAPTTTSGTSGTTNASYTPANNTYIQDQSGEVMQVTAGTGTTSLTVVRGANGSTAVSSANGNQITQGAIPGASTPTGGLLFVHAVFSGLPLNVGDSISFTINTKFQ